MYDLYFGMWLCAYLQYFVDFFFFLSTYYGYLLKYYLYTLQGIKEEYVCNNQKEILPIWHDDKLSRFTHVHPFFYLRTYLLLKYISYKSAI